MNYKEYYINQIGGSFPVFRGDPFQRGYGLGGAFRRFFKWVMPIINQHALPVVKNVGKELVKGVSNVAMDSIEGKNFEESANNRLNEAVNNIKSGKGYKRKKKSLFTKNKRNKKIKIDDIFSQKWQH